MTHPHTHDSEPEVPDPLQPLANSGLAPEVKSRLALSWGPATSLVLRELEFGQQRDQGLSVSERLSVADALLCASAFPAQREPYHQVLCDYPLKPEAQRTWQRNTQRVLDFIGADAAGEGVRLLRRLLARQPKAWPSAARLARCSSGLMETEASRMLEGYACLISGSGDAALKIFSELKEHLLALASPSLLHEGVAYSYILLNDKKSALHSMELAAELPGARVSSLAWSLYLALQVGSTSEIERTAARLDMLVAATSTEFAACLARMRASRELLQKIEDRALGRAPIQSTRVKEWARECRSSSGRVARAME